MTDGYLYVAEFCIISHEVPTPGEDTQIKRNKTQVVLLKILLCTSVILFSSFHFSFRIKAFDFRSLLYQCLRLPASEGWLPASSQYNTTNREEKKNVESTYNKLSGRRPPEC